MSEIKGLATGIGSLPHKDTDTALDLIFKYLPNIPFWPQLPKRDIREGMVAQFSERLPCIKVTDKGIFFNPEDKEKELEEFYKRIISKDIEYFEISQNFASGLYAFYQRLSKSDLKHIKFIKCQVTGPFTFAASIKDEKGNVLLYDPEFMQVISEGILMKALWQINLFKEFGKQIILFYDEPYLGCFGSAYTPINREDVINVLAESGEGFKDVAVKLLSEVTIKDLIPGSSVLWGVHCCGNTDWSIFTDLEKIDIISFDAFDFLDRLTLYADNLKGFFRRGGLLCWGIVPTQEFTDKINKDSLITRMKSGIDTLVRKGLDRDLLWNNLLISPSCGLGTLDMDRSENIFRLLQEISSFIKSQ